MARFFIAKSALSILNIPRLIFVILILALLCGCNGGGSKDLAPGVPVASYPVLRLDGSSVELKDLYGKVTVLCLMASWCESCKSEFAQLNALYKKMKPQGGVVLGLALDDTLQALKDVQKEYNIEFPIVFDSQAKARKVFKLTGFPETLVLDSKGAPKLLQDAGGNFTIKFIGPRPWDQPAYETQILELLSPDA